MVLTPSQADIQRSQSDTVHISVERLLSLRHLGSGIQLHARKRTQSSIDGDLATRFRGRGMEFAEVRPYHAGDDIRNIDWRVTARTQKTHTKLFQEERERPVFVVTDQRASMFFGTQSVFKSVYAAELAACIAWGAMANNDRIGALIFGDNDQKDLRPKRGKHAVLAFLHQLHTFNSALNNPNASAGHTLTEQLEDMSRIAKPGSAIYVISDFHDFDSANDGAAKRALSQLSKHTDVNLFMLYDPFEMQLPEKRSLTLSNGESRLDIHTNRHFTEQYTNKFQEHLEQVHHCARQSGASFRQVDITSPIERTVNDAFVLGGRARSKR